MERFLLRLVPKGNASLLDPIMQCWDDEHPAARFLRRLRRQRARELMRDKDYLRRIRFKHEVALSDQKAYGSVWAEYGTNVYQLIAEATNGWAPSEDDQKSAAYIPPPKKEGAVNSKGDQTDDNLVAAREAGPRERFDELQGKPEASELVVEEDQGREIRLRGGAEEEEARAQEKGGGRGEDFYARAGGTR